MIHAILGPGGDTVPADVIKDGLKDLLSKGDELALPWYGKPSKALETVYDYAIDNEITFYMFSKTAKYPAVFDESGTVTVTENVEKSLAQMASPNSKAAVLFPDEEEDISKQIFGFMDFAPDGATVVDLTNGLVPLEVDDDGEEEAPEPAAAEEEELDGFSREELQGLSLKLLKRAVSDKFPDAVVTDKEQAIAILLGESAPEPEVVWEERDIPDGVVSVSKEGTLAQIDEAIGSCLILHDQHPSHEVSMAMLSLEQALVWLRMDEVD